MEKIGKLMSPRMMMVADAVRKCTSVFDTGTDHAFVPIYLISKGICETATASDVRKGPLKVADRNIKKFHLGNKITTEMGFGIENAGGFDCIIIAGMGGQLIVDILKRDSEIACRAQQLILQPMNAPEKLRMYLWNSGYQIINENLCSEKNKVYNVIIAVYAGEKVNYVEWQLHSSKILVDQQHDLLKAYLEPKLKRLRDMKDGTGDPSGDIKKLIAKLEEIPNDNI